MHVSPDVEHSPACKEIIHATEKRRKHCDKYGDWVRNCKAACHTSGCRCVGFACSPQSHSYLCSWGFTLLPPFCSSNYSGGGDALRLRLINTYAEIVFFAGACND
ncbi:TPA: hypothetical protein F6U11_17635 [Citrobacter freundii]|nr:hypothetical protein [Citrobacter freundii]